MFYYNNVQKSIQFSVFVLFSFFCLINFSACTKEEGEGGKATIAGTLYKIKSDGIERQSDEAVYIIYGGEGTNYDDDVKTSYDGSFRFEYLREGNYTIFAYTDCDDPNDFEACIERMEVEIAKGDRMILLDSLIVD